jgi:hypothetical protein
MTMMVTISTNGLLLMSAPPCPAEFQWADCDSADAAGVWHASRKRRSELADLGLTSEAHHS